MGCKVNQIINPFGFVGARLANGVLKNDTDIELCSVFPAPLPSPTGAVAVPVSSSEIQVTWVYSGDISKVSQFQIDRSLDGVDWTFGGNTPNNVLVFNDTGRNPETEYFYRVLAIAVPPDTNSSPSNTTSATTLSPNPLELFGVNLHAWLRSDDVVLNSGYVSQWNDLSGNGRHLTNATATQQPFYNSGGVEGYNYLNFNAAAGGVFVGRLFNNSWGMGTDPYFVISVLRLRSNTGSNVWLWVSRANSSDGGTANDHAYLIGGSSDLESVRVNRGSNYYQAERGAGQGQDKVLALSATYDLLEHRQWNDGVLQNNNTDVTGGALQSFDQISLGGSNSIPSVFPSVQEIYEYIIVKGVPSDYGFNSGDEFNKIHTGYLSETYPSLPIVDPNIP